VGQPTGGGMGAVVVNPVARIPLPRQFSRKSGGQPDRMRKVPTPPPSRTPKRESSTEPGCYPIQGRNALKQRSNPQPNKFRAQQQDGPTSSIATPASA